MAPMTDSIAALMDEMNPKLKVYIDWCTVDLYDPGEALDIQGENTRLASLLQQGGHDVTARELRSGTGWGTWRSQTGELLRTLIPMQSGGGE